MSKLIHLIGSVALTVIGLTSPAIAQEVSPASSIPDKTYEIHPGALLDDAPYISGFECLVHGEDYYRRPVCDYYTAEVSSPLMMSKISEEVCFKELTPVSTPREYKAETIYRIIVESELGKKGYYEGVTFARILSYPEIDYDTPWYVTTTVALYDCDVPYDGKSNN